MTIRVGKVRQALASAWPELEAALREHDADPITGGLEYMEMGFIARFLGERLRAGDTDHFASLFAAVERCLAEGDDEAVTLVVVGLLEDLQNSNMTGVSDAAAWRPHLGPQAQVAWQAVEDFWNGDHEAIRRYSPTPAVKPDRLR